MKTNSYPNWLVSVEIAKELKEIGFKENCYFEFSYDNGLTLEANKRDENTIIEIDDLLFCTNEVWQNISIPTWEQAFEWFRKKGFRISLENHEDSTKFMFYNMKINEGKHFKGEYSNYEEAREVLINKLIKIYEDNIQSRSKSI